MKYNYTEEGYKNMTEAADRGRQRRSELSKQNKLDYLANPKLCPHCKGPVPYEKKSENTFCSQSCGASYVQRGRKRKPTPTFLCAHCGKENVGKRGKFCNSQCSADSRKFDIDAWLHGEVSGDTVMGCSAVIKRYLLEQCEGKCPKCGWGETHPVTGNVPLEINHIDGDSKNNSPENLEVLCPNCHSLTPNFRALNKKSSRTNRGLRTM
jgi:hypothetical protein